MRQRVDEEQVKLLQQEDTQLASFQHIYESSDGKALIAYLDKAMEETTTIEDTKDLSALDRDARHDFLMATRSKRQTLRAIRKLLATAAEKRIELQKELG
jgi:hypothetical protein